MAGSASAAAVKRIEDVRQLRQFQFPEDAGPMAHPVRPDSYQAIDNFYTATVYEKGAELVRMMHTLVGREGFARGMTLYFERHDGQAVTCDDFVQAIADANPDSELARQLAPFKRWYAQAGTPRVQAQWQHDAATGRLTLTLEQSCPATPGQPEKVPFVIPVTLGLIGPDGRAQPLQLEDDAGPAATERVLVLSDARQSWTFTGLAQAPVPSLLRGFSAPVVLRAEYTEAELLTLLAHDHDAFNRWEASQRLALTQLLAAVHDGVDPVLGEPYLQALRQVLLDPALDAAFKDLVLTLPSETYIAGQLPQMDPQRIHAVREAMKRQLATALDAEWQLTWDAHHDTGAYAPDPRSSGRRALANLALGMLCLSSVQRGDPVWPGRALQRFKDAGNMTDRLGALSALLHSHSELATGALERFHALFRQDPLVIDKWFALQATAPERDGKVFERCRALLQHPDFSLKNPNRARSLLISLCLMNPAAFHRADAAGYVFWAERVCEIDAINPQLAARLARAMDNWKQLIEPYRSAAREAIVRVAGKADLSADVREVVSRALD